MAQNNPPDDKPLAQFVAASRKTLAYAALFSLCINLMMLAMPLYSLQVLDRVISSHSTETLLMLTIVVVAMLVFYGLFMSIRSFTLNSICEWLDTKLAPELFADAITKSSLGLNVNAAQYQRDLGTIKGFIANGLATMLDAPWSFIFLLVIYMINPILGFLGIIGLVFLIGFGIANEFATRKPIEQGMRYNIKSQEIADIASRNASAIESMGMMRNVVKFWDEHHAKGVSNSSRGSKRANVIQSSSRVVRMIIQVGVTGVGGWLALQNELTVGGMIASSILVGRALAPFENAIGIWKSWIATRESYSRMNKNLKAVTQLERGTVDLPQPTGKISIESLIYTPQPSNPIIKGISFGLNAGEGLGIIGPAGAGKSTLTKLIMGLMPPTHGSVRLDAADTYTWNRANFGKYVGYLPQEVELFAGTIKDNIARMDMDAPMEAVIEAAQMAGVHEMILRLPNGYETNCDRNQGLSPGQRQRVGLARALYGKPRLIVLDEPNSNLDGEGERALIGALTNMKRERMTFIVVAHRPSVVSMVDKILVLRSGMIEQFGAREEVFQKYMGGSNPETDEKMAAAMAVKASPTSEKVPAAKTTTKKSSAPKKSTGKGSSTS
jgi:PrtD family type I secretion system ABC transporter